MFKCVDECVRVCLGVCVGRIDPKGDRVEKETYVHSELVLCIVVEL